MTGGGCVSDLLSCAASGVLPEIIGLLQGRGRCAACADVPRHLIETFEIVRCITATHHETLFTMTSTPEPGEKNKTVLAPPSSGRMVLGRYKSSEATAEACCKEI